jgi:hypothetical protein
MQTLGPRFEEFEAELAALGELRDKPAATVSRLVVMRSLGRQLPNG